jgi:hypothetical protein
MITQDNIYRINVKELEEFVSARRGRPWKFFRQTGHVGQQTIEYDLSRPPRFLLELVAAQVIPDKGTLLVDCTSPRVGHSRVVARETVDDRLRRIHVAHMASVGAR